MGYTSGIVIVKPDKHQRAERARDDIRQHFPLQAQVYMGADGLPPCEFAIATGWDTAYMVRAFQGAVRKLYFVQDFEPSFYAIGSESVLAENTYRFGFSGITAGGWLAEKLRAEYGMRTHAVGFGVEQERYQQLSRREPKSSGYFYARPTPRRAFRLGLLVLNAVWRRLPQTQFVLAELGYRGLPHSIPTSSLWHGSAR